MLDKWRTAVNRILEADTVAVFDGNLFHGNMTALLLMDSSRQDRTRPSVSSSRSPPT